MLSTSNLQSPGTATLSEEDDGGAADGVHVAAQPPPAENIAGIDPTPTTDWDMTIVEDSDMLTNAFSAHTFKTCSTAKQNTVLILKQGQTRSDTEQKDMDQWYKETVEKVPYDKTGRYKKNNRLRYTLDCYKGHEKSYLKWCKRNKKKP